MNSIHRAVSYPGWQSNSVRREPELVAAAKAGSRSAFTELYNEYSRIIYRRIFAIMRNRSDAEDAMQDCFLKAFVGIRQFKGKAEFSTWLMRIAINCSLTVLRKGYRRSEFSIGIDDSYPQISFRDRLPNPEQRYDHVQRYRGVVNSIKRLPAHMRVVAELRLLHEKSIDETGEILGLSQAATKARFLPCTEAIDALGSVSVAVFCALSESLEESA